MVEFATPQDRQEFVEEALVCYIAINGIANGGFTVDDVRDMLERWGITMSDMSFRGLLTHADTLYQDTIYDAVSYFCNNATI